MQDTRRLLARRQFIEEVGIVTVKTQQFTIERFHAV